MKLLAVDPGGTTGWASFELKYLRGEPLWRSCFAEHFVQSGQLGPDDHHNALDEVLETQDPDIVLCERFEHRNNEFAELVSVEYVGVVKRWCQRRDRTLAFQGASQALPWADNKKMRHLDVLRSPVTMWRHDNDARRHIIYMLANRSKDKGIENYVLKLFYNMR